VITPATTVALKQFDQLTIFDGPSSEQVQLAADAAVGSTVITLLAGTQYAHAAYTLVCSDGVDGSLADQIVFASAWIENITLQSLFAATYTNEKLRIPSMRAAWSEGNQELVFRPRQFPVTAVSALSLKSSTSETAYDVSKILIDDTEQTASLASVCMSSQQSGLYLQLTYTAGYPVATFPKDIRDAAVLLTSELLSRQKNPSGAIEYQLGKRRFRFSERGGQSQLVCEATNKLRSYSVKAF
jgi:hypothetical protein